jgi:UDP-N-acetyl-2-amino-2-deoxyglucuronate dehydrogenase
MGFGVVGSGMIAAIHASAIRSMKGGSLAGIFNPRPGAAEKLAAEHGVPAYSDWDAFLAHPGMRAVTIATPSGCHLEGAERAARAGKHVLCEKPLEVNLERIDAMIRVCSENGVRLAAIHQRRFQDATRVFKDAIDQGRFGRISLADATVKWFRTQEYYDQGGWRGTWRLDGGGALMNQSIHTIDQLLHLVGDVASVCALASRVAHERIQVEDVAVAALRFRNGALGVIEGSTACFSKTGHAAEVHVCGSEGSVFMRDNTFTAWEFRTGRPGDETIVREYGATAGAAGAGAADPRAIPTLLHRRVFEDFADAVASGRPSAVPGAEARKAVEVILAIYESARAGGTPVSLPLGRSPDLSGFDPAAPSD